MGTFSLPNDGKHTELALLFQDALLKRAEASAD